MKLEPTSIKTDWGVIHPWVCVTPVGEIYVCTKEQYFRLYGCGSPESYSDEALAQDDDPFAPNVKTLNITYNFNSPISLDSDVVGGNFNIDTLSGDTLHSTWGSSHRWNLVYSRAVAGFSESLDDISVFVSGLGEWMERVGSAPEKPIKVRQPRGPYRTSNKK